MSEVNQEYTKDGAISELGSVLGTGAGANAGDNIVHEVTGIDFSAGTTVITDSGGATGTIVNADVAKGATTNDITM